MDSYPLLKLVHIVSAALLFGTGLGTAFFLFMVNRYAGIAAIRSTARTVVLADWVFTTPAVIIQPVTGYLLMQKLGYSFDSSWFVLVAGLYGLAGLCWLPVVYIQLRIRALAEVYDAYDALPPLYHRLIRTWTLLGIPAFSAVLALFGLMVYKPWL